MPVGMSLYLRPTAYVQRSTYYDAKTDVGTSSSRKVASLYSTMLYSSQLGMC